MPSCLSASGQLPLSCISLHRFSVSPFTGGRARSLHSTGISRFIAKPGPSRCEVAICSPPLTSDAHTRASTWRTQEPLARLDCFTAVALLDAVFDPGRTRTAYPLAAGRAWLARSGKRSATSKLSNFSRLWFRFRASTLHLAELPTLRQLASDRFRAAGSALLGKASYIQVSFSVVTQGQVSPELFMRAVAKSRRCLEMQGLRSSRDAGVVALR